MNRDDATRELTEAAVLLLDAMAAERRIVELPSTASLQEARSVLVDAEAKRAQALDRFGVTCARLAIGLKGSTP
jgi:hypothetical protein